MAVSKIHLPKYNFFWLSLVICKRKLLMQSWFVRFIMILNIIISISFCQNFFKVFQPAIGPIGFQQLKPDKHQMGEDGAGPRALQAYICIRYHDFTIKTSSLSVSLSLSLSCSYSSFKYVWLSYLSLAGVKGIVEDKCLFWETNFVAYNLAIVVVCQTKPTQLNSQQDVCVCVCV